MRVVRPFGVSFLCLFFVFGTAMSGLAAVTLWVPGSPLDSAWRINSRGHEGLVALGTRGIVLMVAVSLACSAAATGLWLRRRWGMQLVVTILAVNAAGDLLNAVLWKDPRTLIGLPIAGALLGYLSTSRVRAFFNTGAD